VAELCSSVLLLSRGQTVRIGPPVDVIGAYLRGTATAAGATGTESPVVVESATMVGVTEPESGDNVCFRIEGFVRADVSRHVEPVGIIVRSAQTGEIVFATGTSVLGITLDVGDFSLEVSLQMNVQPGIYLIDIGVWDRAEEKQLMVGPTLNFRVRAGTTFLGEVNLNPVMRRVSAARLPVGA